MTETPSSAGKGRPTPKRSEAQRRRGPVAPPPTNRREAAKRQRENNAGKGDRARKGGAGRERPMLARDAGPVRQLVRDVVDSRRNAAVLLLPASVLPLASQLLSNPAVARFFTTLWLAAFLLAIADVAITTVRVRNALKRDFAQERLSKHVFYAVMRCVTFRRFRLPKPQVAVNQQV